jgi:hypothetical protein
MARLIGLSVLNVLATICSVTIANGPADTQSITIGSRRELFVDQYLIDTLRDVRLELQHPQPQEIAIACDQPWEGSACGYFRVLQDGGKYRMWYMAYHWPFAPDETAPQHPFYVAYAESADGITWHKPDLELFEFQGSKKNNICCVDVVDNFTPFLDTNPQCPADARYKAVGLGQGGLLAYGSPDGIQWRRLQAAPVMTKGAFDSQNLAFWDDATGLYRAYFRDFHNGIRDIRSATSQDFLTWTAPETLQFPAGTPDEQLYTNGVSPYYRAPHLYLGFPTRYVERNWSPSMRALPDVKHRELRSKVEQRIGTAITDGLFMSSRDGKTFQRWGEAFVRSGPERPGTWVYGDCYQAYGLVETASKFPGAPPELSLYLPENYWHRTAKMRRYTLRMDGFVAACAPLSGGEIVTKPIVFSGKTLMLNFATSAAGSVRVELQDAQGTPLPGHTLDDCDELFGDTLDRAVSWKESTDLSAVSGQTIRVRFVLRDADLFAFQFHD